ncbi:MAG TPA: lysophospholipid acyltransferase family protein [Rhizomicrobium sp.]|jgi:1-acyl-sn-glycerol-3-phosphate acyltransferase|nr:lysophospholipid acyltransferase family protein [Rhizomicrobium sp.]
MQSLRAAVLLSVFLLVTLVLIPWQETAVLFRLRRRKTFPNRYHRFLCRLFGIRVTIVGRPVQSRGVLMVANHTSYFDIIVLSAAARVAFVAKREVATWPLFGTLARLQETVFIAREKRSQTVEARNLIRERLAEGDALILFPEGTSDDGNGVRPFKSALMGAVEAELGTDTEGRVRRVPVQPVSISYVGLYGLPMARDMRPLIAWYGDMDLVPHLWEAIKLGPFEAVVQFHDPLSIDSDGDRKQLATTAEAMVRRGQARALAGLPPQTNALRKTEPRNSAKVGIAA